MVTVAYCAGIFAYFAIRDKIIIISIIYIAFVLIFLKAKKDICKINRFFVYLTIVFFVIGAYSAGQKEKYLENNIPDNDSEIFLCGQIYKYEQKENSYAVYLKNCVYTYEQNISDSLAINHKSRLRCLIYTKDMNDFKIGSIISVSGSVNELQSPSNIGQFDERAYYLGLDVHFKMFAEKILSYKECRTSVFQKFYNIKSYFHNRLSKITDKKTAGIYQAMLLGEKDSVDSGVKDLFMQGSIGHILVVSGLHFSIIGMAVFIILRKRFGYVSSGIISCMVLFLFGILSGFSTSALRAFIMLAVFMCANIWGRDYDLPTALSLAVLIILIGNPYTLFLSGFVLSVSAVLGVIIVVPVLEEIFHCKSKIIKGMFASLGIQIFTLPIMLYYFYYFNPYSMLLNAVVLPFMSFVLADGAGAVFISLSNITLARILILPGKFILKGVIILCEAVTKAPFASIYPGRPKFITCVIYYILLFAIIYLLRRSKKISKLYSIVLVSLSLIFFVHKRYPLEITMLDVGQGQSIFVKMKSGLNLLYDGGSSDISDVGEYRIIPFLQAKGCVSLDAVFISHLDEDHISGIQEMIICGDIFIGQIFLPDTDLIDEAYLKIEKLAKDNGITVNRFGCGDCIKYENVEINALHPTKDFPAAKRNDTSIVFNMEYNDFNILFCGDMEEDAMNHIMSDNRLKDVDILQVAHHGSAYTTSEDFLAITRPEVSLISCGENNRYKHPHEELIGRLQNINSRIYVTMDCGEIDIKISENKYEVESFKR